MSRPGANTVASTGRLPRHTRSTTPELPPGSGLPRSSTSARVAHMKALPRTLRLPLIPFANDIRHIGGRSKPAGKVHQATGHAERLSSRETRRREALLLQPIPELASPHPLANLICRHNHSLPSSDATSRPILCPRAEFQSSQSPRGWGLRSSPCDTRPPCRAAAETSRRRHGASRPTHQDR